MTAATFFGRCLDCGDEWAESTAPAICPECHSLHVENDPPLHECPSTERATDRLAHDVSRIYDVLP